MMTMCTDEYEDDGPDDGPDERIDPEIGLDMTGLRRASLEERLAGSPVFVRDKAAMSAMDDLIAFMKARLDEDEAIATAAAQFGTDGFSGRPQWINQYGMVVDATDSDWAIVDLGGTAVSGEPVYAHIARHDPARTLREVAADRALLAEYDELANGLSAYMYMAGALEGIIRYRVTVWSDHPDYRDEWRPSAAEG